ncbi:MAG: hypothetical protein HOO96_20760 [Polyangiaceae bacterium]|nr:hypothetical protein [Polyangiaceae bacterium]
MQRKTFLTIAAVIGLTVGLFASLAPGALLAGKGIVEPSGATEVWVREVGVAIIAISATSFAVRSHGDSPTLRVLLLGNAFFQAMLFPIELVAYARGIITTVAGVAPNSVLHVLLATGFVYYARRAGGEAAAADRA